MPIPHSRDGKIRGKARLYSFVYICKWGYDVVMWSERAYGNRVGIWRLMEVLDRYRIRASVALNSGVLLVARRGGASGRRVMGRSAGAPAEIPHPTLPRLRGRVGWGRWDTPRPHAIAFATATLLLFAPPPAAAQ